MTTVLLVYITITWPLKMGPIGCPEKSVINPHSILRNIPEERRSHTAVEALNYINEPTYCSRLK